MKRDRDFVLPVVSVQHLRQGQGPSTALSCIFLLWCLAVATWHGPQALVSDRKVFGPQGSYFSKANSPQTPSLSWPVPEADGSHPLDRGSAPPLQRFGSLKMTQRTSTMLGSPPSMPTQLLCHRTPRPS